MNLSLAGNAAAPDNEITDYASQHGLVVLTHNLDFGALLAKQKARQPSVVQIRTQDVMPSAVGDIVVRALRASGPIIDGREMGAQRSWNPAQSYL